MNVFKLLKSHKNEIKTKYDVKKIGIFGSYAKGQRNEESDVVPKHFVFGTSKTNGF